MTRHRVLHDGEQVAGTSSAERAPTPLSVVSRGGQDGATLASVVLRSGLDKPTARRLPRASMRAAHRAGCRVAPLCAGPGGLRAGDARGCAPWARRPGGGVAPPPVRSDWRQERRFGPPRRPCAPPASGGGAACCPDPRAAEGRPATLGVGARSLAILAARPQAERAAAMLGMTDARAARLRYSIGIVRDEVGRTLDPGFALGPARRVPGSWGGVSCRSIRAGRRRFPSSQSTIVSGQIGSGRWRRSCWTGPRTPRHASRGSSAPRSLHNQETDR